MFNEALVLVRESFVVAVVFFIFFFLSWSPLSSSSPPAVMWAHPYAHQSKPAAHFFDFFLDACAVVSLSISRHVRNSSSTVPPLPFLSLSL